MTFVIGNLLVMFSAQMNDFICRLFNVFRSFVWAIIPVKFKCLNVIRTVVASEAVQSNTHLYLNDEFLSVY